VKAVGIIGYHHTGKTTLAVALIEALTQAGFCVASIKDIHNENFSADVEGSNSWRHARAGANQVFARGLWDAALVLTPSPDLKAMLGHLNADYLVIEGLKDAAVPRIVCADDTAQADELIDDTVFALAGRIADSLESYRGLPVFCLRNRLPELVQTVKNIAFKILPQADPDCCSACGRSCYLLAGDIVQGRAKREECIFDSAPALTLTADGKPVPLVPFVQNILRDTVLALVDNLKDIPPDSSLRLELNR
jgi:molybdopterin-guanine dinucleotide biosynthesis protein B